MKLKEAFHGDAALKNDVIAHRASHALTIPRYDYPCRENSLLTRIVFFYQTRPNHNVIIITRKGESPVSYSQKSTIPRHGHPTETQAVQEEIPKVSDMSGNPDGSIHNIPDHRCGLYRDLQQQLTNSRPVGIKRFVHDNAGPSTDNRSNMDGYENGRSWR